MLCILYGNEGINEIEAVIWNKYSNNGFFYFEPYNFWVIFESGRSKKILFENRLE